MFAVIFGTKVSCILKRHRKWGFFKDLVKFDTSDDMQMRHQRAGTLQYNHCQMTYEFSFHTGNVMMTLLMSTEDKAYEI